jgi:hypothetical protein
MCPGETIEVTSPAASATPAASAATSPTGDPGDSAQASNIISSKQASAANSLAADAASPKHTPRMRFGATTVNGRLKPEQIQVSVRARWSKFLRCYDEKAESNPNLAGLVSMRLVIGRDGLVTNASDRGSTLPDPDVISCVQRVFYAICFPHPEDGIVTVVYPIMFGS